MKYICYNAATYGSCTSFQSVPKTFNSMYPSAILGRWDRSWLALPDTPSIMIYDKHIEDVWLVCRN